MARKPGTVVGADTGTEKTHAIKVAQPGPSAADLLDALSNEAPAPAKKAGPKKVRPIITLTGDDGKQYDALCAADEIFKKAKQKVEATKETCTEIVKARLMELWYNNGAPIENPDIKGPYSTGIFQVKDQIKFNTAEPGEGETLQDAARAALVEAGLPEEVATQVANEEVILKPTVSLKSFNDLTAAGGASAEVAKKIMSFVVTSLTAAERQLVVEKKVEAVAKEGFLSRAASYCESAEELAALLLVLKPVYAHSSLKYTGGDAAAIVAGK